MKSTALISTLLLCQHHAMACVGCRQPGVGGADEPQTVLAGVAFSWSVIIMLLFLASLVGGLGFYIAKTCRQVDRKNLIS